MIDAPRTPTPAGGPPERGAQWDELHGRWEVWDEPAASWRVVGDPGDGVDPADENPLAPHLARALAAAGPEAEPPADRGMPVELDDPPVRGAQWNEVAARWERWDEAAGGWVGVATEP